MAHRKTPLILNNVEKRRSLIVILSAHATFLSLIMLGHFGIDFPIVRPLFCFVYLCFIPGYLIMGLLQMKYLCKLEHFLYSVGLSIASLMFIGLLINFLYPSFGFYKPISTLYLTVTFTFFIGILCFACWKCQNVEFPVFFNSERRYMVSVEALLCYLLPLITVLGTYFVNYYQNTILLLLVIFLIALSAVFINNYRAAVSNLYPLIIFSLSLSLLYHNSLISEYIWGWDINVEYRIASLVLNNSMWDSGLYSNVNSMLSIVMLSPIFSILCDLSLDWVFKIYYPIIYSLVPVALYQLFQKQTNPKIAFYSVFFFVSVFTFYTEMLQLARQEIAELYLALLLLLFFDERSEVKKTMLKIVFAVCLITSHYGISYIIMTLFMIIVIIFHVSEKTNIYKSNLISKNFMILFSLILFAWYMYTTQSSIFNNIIYIFNRMILNLISEFLNPQSTQALNIIITNPTSPLHQIGKIMHLIAQLFIFIGLVASIKNYLNLKMSFEYKVFSSLFFSFMIANVFVPYMSNSLNTTRLYHISLFLLSPFFVLGIISVYSLITNYLHNCINHDIKSAIRIVSYFLFFFLLFNSNWFYVVGNEYPHSLSLGHNDFPKFSLNEISSAEWLHKHEIDGYVYADYYRLMLFYRNHDVKLIKRIDLMKGYELNPSNNYFIYLGSFNTRTKTLLVEDKSKYLYISPDAYVEHNHLIYSNGYSHFYMVYDSTQMKHEINI